MEHHLPPGSTQGLHLQLGPGLRPTAIPANPEGHVHLLWRRSMGPAPGNGRKTDPATPQLKPPVPPPQGLLSENPAVVGPEQGGRVTHAKGGQGPEGGQESPVDLLQTQVRLRGHHPATVPLLKGGGGPLLQALLQMGHPVGGNGESPGSGVPSKGVQQLPARLKRCIHGKPTGGPHGGTEATLVVPGQQRHWAAKALHQPCGNNANHPMVPVVLGQEQERRRLDPGGNPISLQQCQGFSLNGGAQFPPLLVQVLAKLGHGHGLLL